MDPIHANILFDKIEGFAAYAFNLSHSVEYTIISYWAMWLKTYYPAEFYAASMSIQDDADKLGVLVMDAKQNGITVSPPDINISTNRVEIADDKTLTAPFQAIKGISTNVANYIVQCRAKTGAFKSKEHFEASLKEQGLAGKVNISHRTKLDKVGAFFGVDGGVTPHDPIRLRDRLELMPGYTIDTVKASRAIDLVVVKTGLLRMLEEVRACEKCSLKDAGHVLPRVGKSPKFMVVLDSPSWVEEKKGKLLEGETGDIVKAAFSDAGLELTNAYVTALVRAPKGRGVKTLSNDQVIQCSEYLRREVEILKPPVILVLGSAAARYFTPEVKGTMADLAGKVIFDPKLDASIVFGVNPAQVLFNSSLVSSLLSACMKVKSLIV
jgi:DNA polymerase-3 subunit alpha